MSQAEQVLQSLAVGQKALITSDSWFYGPDGCTYRAVFGTVHKITNAEETLGIKPNARSTNWYVHIGNMVVAGCQIHFAIRTDKCRLGEVSDYREEEGREYRFTRPSHIYNADEGLDE